MAANSVWIATGAGAQDYSAAGSWTGGVPEAAEEALIAAGDSGCNITSGMAQSAIDLAKLSIGSRFFGTLGTSSSPLVVGTTTLIDICTPKAPSINIQTNTGDTTTTTRILDCSPLPYGVHLTSNGTGAWTNVYIIKGGFVRIGAAFIGTNLYVLGSATVHIEAGAKIGRASCRERVSNRV